MVANNHLEQKNQMQKVIVGMSGGVDSSVSAYLLLEQGYQVEGLFMKNWEEDDDDIYCSAADDLNDAQQVCDHLNIPLHKINFASEYWDSVFEYFLAEYKAGRTPNPDVLCNKEIKFKAFLDYALNHLHADWIAMGHYARVCHFTDGTPTQLLRGVDANKDQTYFLNALTHTQLSRALFPIGELQKPQVREIASEQGLITAKKKDSTGICFIGERQFKTFLATYLPAQPGHIETTDGTLLGTHQGLMYHTLGQRKGLGIGGVHDALEEAWYVVDKDLKRNVLIVGQGADHPRLKSKGCFVNQLNFIDETTVTEPRQCTVKTRYRQQDIPCTLYPVATAETENDMIYVRFDDEQIAVTPGQSAVFYQDERCLGGGVIDQRFSHAEDEQLLYSNNKTGLTHITYESKVI